MLMKPKFKKVSAKPKKYKFKFKFKGLQTVYYFDKNGFIQSGLIVGAKVFTGINYYTVRDSEMFVKEQLEFDLFKTKKQAEKVAKKEFYQMLKG